MAAGCFPRRVYYLFPVVFPAASTFYMTTKSESITKLAAALAAAQAEMPSIPFDATNPFLKNKYASLGSVIEHSRPILARHGLSITQPPINEGDRIGVESTLLHTSGEFITTTFTLPLGDEKGKSLAQVAGSVVTYLRRYSWSSILGLYADEDTDGEVDTAKRPVTHSVPQKALTTPQAPQKPPISQPRAKSEPSSQSADHKILVTQLVKLCGPAMLPELTRALRDMPRKNGGSPMLLPNEEIADLPMVDLKALVNNWDKAYPKIDEWLRDNPPKVVPLPEPEKPAAPANKPDTSLWPDGTQTHQGVIVDVSEKKGTQKSGQPYTRYGVKIGDVWYSTFSHDHGANAKSWKDRPVTVAFTVGKHGNDLVDLFLDDQPEGVTP